MANNNNVDKKKIFIGFVFVLICLSPLFFFGFPYIESILFVIFISAALASAWNILGGYTGQFSVGHSLFFGLGAYTTVLMYVRFGISPWVGMLFGALLAFVFSLTVGRVLLRLHSHFFALSTIAALLVFSCIATYWQKLTGGAAGIAVPFVPGIRNMAFKSVVYYVYLALAFLIIMLVVSYKIKSSRTGFYFQAIREDEYAANALGVNVQYYKTAALSISAFFTAIGGAIFVIYSGHVTPTFAFSLDRSIDMVLFPIIGGIGTVLGPLVGTFIVVPISEYLRGLLGGKIVGLNYIIYGVILIIIILRAPEGIMGLRRRRIQKTSTSKPEKTSPERISVRQREEKINVSTPEQISPVTLSNSEQNLVVMKVNNLTKTFGGIVALKDVSFEIKKGEVFGLIGPNGAGKTTLFNSINGFYKPDKGEIIFNEHLITGLPPYKICKMGIGRTFQHVRPLKGLTALENIMIGAFLHYKSSRQAMHKALQIIDLLGLYNKRDKLASGLDIFEQKKLEIGKALAGDPQLLLLDEIMAGLNPTETDALLSFLREIASSGITLFLIEHKMKAIMSVSDRILVIDHGKKLVEGTPKEVCEHEAVIEAYLGQRKFT
ncbi:branched-chain amino acid ABC transporter ATP-binding protein/permease [Candidatus Aerophobetes bacterium]|nr:branched-chain amino acid ABC transporter ATP-binding protein/permease [Candidatus Aerophobetes bacterium]